MSVPGALQFIAAVRKDPDLVRMLHELGPGTTLERLVALGASRGWSFSADELRTAYKVDWSMRMGRYRKRPA